MSAPIKNKKPDLKANLVILGSGGGLIAAVAAAQNGTTEIIVLEKQATPGGNTRLAHGFFAVESPVQKREKIVTSADEYFKKAMNFAHWYRINPRIVRAYINKSGDTVRWLEDMGVKFEARRPGLPVVSHSPVGSGNGLMDTIIKNSDQLGVKLLLNTSGKQILRRAGKVTGVIAETGGEAFKISCRSVIIATGGFPGNVELLQKYCPDYVSSMPQGNWPYHTGDGLIMASQIGAAIAASIPITHSGPIPESGRFGVINNIISSPFVVWLNKIGKRFINENSCQAHESGNAIMQQPDCVMFAIFDDAIRQKMESSGIADRRWGAAPEAAVNTGKSADIINALADKKELTRFGSLAEMADWIGTDHSILIEAINEYNTACDQGYDSIFAREKSRLLPIRKPPYYAIKGVVNCGETMGGIRVTERMEVYDTSFNIIPGLYVAGVLADGWMGQTYYSEEMGGSAMGFAINSGRIAGESAADYIKTLEHS